MAFAVQKIDNGWILSHQGQSCFYDDVDKLLEAIKTILTQP